MAAEPNSDLYGRRLITPVKPITADMCTIVFTSDDPKWADGDQVVAGATNINISYQQQVVRRRTLGTSGGSPLAVIYPTQPIGTIQISRLFAKYESVANSKLPGVANLFSFPGWDICKGTATIKVTFNGASAFTNCAESYGGFRMRGGTVTGYNISAEAEGLTVLDNVTIEFLQMIVAP